MAEDMEQTDFAQEEKDENENHSEVQGSNPADREVEDTSGTQERRPGVQGSNPAGRKVKDTSSTRDRNPEVQGSKPTSGPTTRSRSRVRDHCQGHYGHK